jgi:hypothetical protein
MVGRGSNVQRGFIRKKSGDLLIELPSRSIFSKASWLDRFKPGSNKYRSQVNWVGIVEMVLILVSRLSQQKEMGVPYELFRQKQLQGGAHAAGNDYKDTTGTLCYLLTSKPFLYTMTCLKAAFYNPRDRGKGGEIHEKERSLHSHENDLFGNVTRNSLCSNDRSCRPCQDDRTQGYFFSPCDGH